MAMAEYIGEGRSIPHTPETALSAGDVVNFDTFVGIAITDIAADEQGALGVEGIYNAIKKTGETWAVGEPIYFDEGTSTFSNDVSYSEGPAGIVVAAAVTGDTHGWVKLVFGSSIPLS
jgi:predicted RecA/RadA family phage recombinase